MPKLITAYIKYVNYQSNKHPIVLSYTTTNIVPYIKTKPLYHYNITAQ